MTKITYDSDAEAMMIILNDNKIVDSVQVGNSVLDYDKDGEIVSIELLSVNIDEVIQAGTSLQITKINP
jgi:uncharacterized protein YuzE